MSILMVVVILILLQLSCAFPMLGLWPLSEMRHMHFGNEGLIMWLILLLLIGIVIYLIVGKNRLYVEHHEKETPLEILKKRYARGEITKAEFNKMKKDLGE